nr:glycine zipper 2TM domain-containing protein [Pseudoalteromonas sp. T1lg24]
METLWWSTLGGVIGNQFGDGSGQVAATILGSIIGASIAKNNIPDYRQRTVKLIEMMILTEDKQRVMVIQDYDSHMQFSKGSTVRIVYLQSNTVRVDTAY